MKAISVRQPFPALIAHGHKRLEIRSWQTEYRGPLLICSGLGNHALFDSYDFRTEILKLSNRSARAEYRLSKTPLCFYGRMICVVYLVGIRNFKPGSMSENDACIDWIPNQFAWELENPKLVVPTNIKGKLRLFEVDDSMINYL